MPSTTRSQTRKSDTTELSDTPAQPSVSNTSRGSGSHTKAHFGRPDLSKLKGLVAANQAANQEVPQTKSAMTDPRARAEATCSDGTGNSDPIEQQPDVVNETAQEAASPGDKFYNSRVKGISRRKKQTTAPAANAKQQQQPPQSGKSSDTATPALPAAATHQSTQVSTFTSTGARPKRRSAKEEVKSHVQTRSMTRRSQETGQANDDEAFVETTTPHSSNVNNVRGNNVVDSHTPGETSAASTPAAKKRDAPAPRFGHAFGIALKDVVKQGSTSPTKSTSHTSTSNCGSDSLSAAVRVEPASTMNDYDLHPTQFQQPLLDHAAVAQVHSNADEVRVSEQNRSGIRQVHVVQGDTWESPPIRVDMTANRNGDQRWVEPVEREGDARQQENQTNRVDQRFQKPPNHRHHLQPNNEYNAPSVSGRSAVTSYGAPPQRALQPPQVVRPIQAPKPASNVEERGPTQPTSSCIAANMSSLELESQPEPSRRMDSNAANADLTAENGRAHGAPKPWGAPAVPYAASQGSNGDNWRAPKIAPSHTRPPFAQSRSPADPQERREQWGAKRRREQMAPREFSAYWPQSWERELSWPARRRECDDEGDGTYDRPRFLDAHCHIDLMQTNRISFDKWEHLLTADPNYDFGGCIPNFCYPMVYLHRVGSAQKSAQRQVAAKKSGGKLNKQLANMDLQLLLNKADLLPQHLVIGATFGCHPKHADEYTREVHNWLHNAFWGAHVDGFVPIAVGECGLDESKDQVPSRDDQMSAFGQQLDLAKHFDLPIVIHLRASREEPDALEDIALDLMAKKLDREHHIHRHCFQQSVEVAQKWTERFPNAYFGLTPCVTKHWRDDDPFARFAKEFPLDRIVLETDSPFFGRKYEDGYPADAMRVAEHLAKLRKTHLGEVLRQTERNTRHLYKLDKRNL